ncbi:hypothetical protein EDB84DRAFT_1434898 [Lactarius hengduanensis]|nr:hypothetical protein EDB84DRAFT_1434898 [Lactarius hengduanensis]
MSTATDSPRNDNSNLNDFNHAVPIPILASPHRRRPSTASSDGSPTSPPALQTPISYPTNLAPSSPPSSPIFSYFMSSPPKTSASFPYRRLPGFGAPPVFEDDDGQEIEVRGAHHQRSATTGWAGNGRAASQRAAPAAPVIEAQEARGAGVLASSLSRRELWGLSFPYTYESPFQTNTNKSSSPPEPATSPPSAVTSPVTPGFAAKQTTSQPRRVRRAATMSTPTSSARRRAPSPMGERILKGHFDGFN